MRESEHDAAAERALGKRRNQRRPAAVATVEGERFLTMREVSGITTWHVATIYRKLADPDDDFPRPIRLGPNRIVFRETEIAEYMRSRPVRTPAKRPPKPRLSSSPLRRLAGAAA